MIWALHGNVGMPEDWDEFEAACGEKVEKVDLYGVGGKWGEFGGRLNEMVRRSGDGEAVLLGYSMGGRLGLEALLGEGSPWRAGVIVSAHTGLRRSDERVARLEADRGWAEKVRSLEWGAFLQAWNSQGVFAGGEMAGERGELEWRKELVAQGFEQWSLGRQGDLSGRLGGIGVPVLWVTGRLDEKYSEVGREACERLLDGRPVRMRGAGHRVPWEAREDFVREVLAFRRESLW